MQRLHGREAMLRMRSLPLVTAEALGSVFVHQTVYVFPPPGQPFDPNCVRLVTRGRDPATTVACMLGFFKLVCEDGYKQVSLFHDVHNSAREVTAWVGSRG
ncbi:hypothetical protein HPB51_028631 [Rhipicephalus microplus]|uniref:Uncharacterized protein n=1 Tax=Rhipicephalus microplus TaxID=6941 RepID=A0A9J6CWI1_RHIMP|nr:hypothetical protein HPB51_028631 [Rhipicephalus microplus]